MYFLLAWKSWEYPVATLAIRRCGGRVLSDCNKHWAMECFAPILLRNLLMSSPTAARRWGHEIKTPPVTQHLKYYSQTELGQGAMFHIGSRAGNKLSRSLKFTITKKSLLEPSSGWICLLAFIFALLKHHAKWVLTHSKSEIAILTQRS